MSITSGSHVDNSIIRRLNAVDKNSLLNIGDGFEVEKNTGNTIIDGTLTVSGTTTMSGTVNIGTNKIVMQGNAGSIAITGGGVNLDSETSFKLNGYGVLGEGYIWFDYDEHEFNFHNGTNTRTVLSSNSDGNVIIGGTLGVVSTLTVGDNNPIVIEDETLESAGDKAQNFTLKAGSGLGGSSLEVTKYLHITHDGTDYWLPCISSNPNSID